MKADVLRGPSVNSFSSHTVMYPAHHEQVFQARREIQERVLHKHRTDTQRQHTNERHHAQGEQRWSYQELERSGYEAYAPEGILTSRESRERAYLEQDPRRSSSSMAAIYSSPMQSPRPPYYSPMQSPRLTRYNRPSPMQSPIVNQNNDYDHMSEENRELYEKLNNIKMSDIRSQRVSKGTSYTQKFRERTEAIRRSQNNSRVSMQSVQTGSNVSSRNNSARPGQYTDQQLPSRVQVSRDSQLSYKVGNHTNVLQGQFNSSRYTPNGQIFNNDVMNRDYEVKEPIDVDAQLYNELNRAKNDSLKKVRNSDGPVQVCLGKEDKFKKTKLKKTIENSNSQKFARKRPDSESVQTANNDRGQFDFRYEIPEADQYYDANLPQRQNLPNDHVNDFSNSYGDTNVSYPTPRRERHNESADESGKKHSQSRIPVKAKGEKKNTFAFGSTLKPTEKSAKKTPHAESNITTITPEGPPLRENNERQTHSKKTKAGNQDRAIISEPDENLPKRDVKSKIGESKPKTDNNRVQRTEKLSKSIADETQSHKDSVQKPKKGILRKTSSFKQIANSTNYFGYMSLSQGMAVDKKVVKRVRYNDNHSETNIARPISA